MDPDPGGPKTRGSGGSGSGFGSRSAKLKYRSPLLAADVQRLSGPKLGIPSGLTLDPANRRVFWMDRLTGTVRVGDYGATWRKDLTR